MKVHINAVKAVNVAVLGEFGRHPLHLLNRIKMMKYWCELTVMEETMCPKVSHKYKNALWACNAGKWNRVTYIKETVFKYGFGYLWTYLNNEYFIALSKNGLKNCVIVTNFKYTPNLKHY